MGDGRIEQGGGFLDTALLAEVRAVVGGEDDDGIVEQVELFDGLEETADAVVAESDFGGIEVADDRQVVGANVLVAYAVAEEVPFIGVVVAVHFLEAGWGVPGFVGVEHVEPEHKGFVASVFLEPLSGGVAGPGAEVVVLGFSVLCIHEVLAHVAVVAFVPQVGRHVFFGIEFFLGAASIAVRFLASDPLPAVEAAVEVVSRFEVVVGIDYEGGGEAVLVEDFGEGDIGVA